MAADQLPIITTELLSDLVKIGIPSLVALVGTISSAVLALRGHKKDLQIERLRINNEEEKERNKRKGELIERVSIELTEMQSAFISYTTMLCAKIETESTKETFPEKSRKELSSLYHDLIERLYNGISIEAHISLLGNKGASELFYIYWESLNRVPQEFQPNVSSVSYEEVIRKNQSLAEKYRVILAHLSKIFLMGGK